ncbi:MAG: hypothetical protein B6242_07465, partial [Anaerolineaceae bacterium 4572_78]
MTATICKQEIIISIYAYIFHSKNCLIFKLRLLCCTMKYTIIKESDSLHPLFYIVQDFRKGKLKIPEHQREQAWSDEKILLWIERITGQVGEGLLSGRPLGAIATYTIIGDANRTVWLNDGLQRLTASRLYVDNPEQFGHTSDKAEQYLKEYEIVVQHRYYLSHEVAMIEFQLMNNGTHLTPHDFYKGIIAYMPHYQSFWCSHFKWLHQAIEAQSQRIISKAGKVKYSTIHHRRRHDYLLYHRWLAKNTDVMRILSFNQGAIDFVAVKHGKVLEQLLVKNLQNLGQDKASQALDRFKRFIIKQTDLVKLTYEKLQPRQKKLPLTIYRWLLEVAVWQHQCHDLTEDDWQTFVHDFLKYRVDRQKTPSSENKPKNVSPRLGSLHKVYDVCQTI